MNRPSVRNKVKMAEREGFEPPVGFHLHALSKRAHSTTLPSLRSTPQGGRKDHRRQAKGAKKGRLMRPGQWQILMPRAADIILENATCTPRGVPYRWC